MAVLACLSGGNHALAADEPLRLKLEPRLNEANALITEGRPIYGSGEAMQGRAERETTLQGEAEMRRAGTVVRGDRLTYYPADDEVVAVGNVRIARGGNSFSGPELQLKVDANQGYFRSPDYYLSLYRGRGQAERVDFLGPERLTLTRSTYTTCSAADPDWYLKADRIDIDETQQEGDGRNANLIFKNRNVFWAPSFSFPLGDQRRSGFLAPSFSLVNTTGPELMVPYYFNIAPNRDFTLYNRMMTRRGLQVGGLARYLEPTWFGEARFEYNPRDPVAGMSRHQFSSLHTFTNFHGWSGAWNIKGVSDDNYFVDYSRSIISAAELSLPRDVFATRAFGDWTVTARASRYQNILDARRAPLYERLPQISAQYNKYDVSGFDVSALVDTTSFRRPLIESPEGLRTVVNPSVAWPVVRPAWFFTPKLSVHASNYELGNNGGLPTSLNRTVPTFSLDGGLVFERDASYFGRAFTQTLEPRLFYVRTPYRDQSAFPVFDSYEADFNFAQLFSENRFIGNDRIGDSNQVTAALVTRLINPGTGAETLKLAFGQRYYFSDQRVTIPGAPVRTDTRSDLLFAATGDLGRGLSFDGGVQYSVADQSVPRASFNVRWRADDGRVFNTGVRYLRDDLGQFDTSWRLPIAPRWVSLGRLNYSFLHRRIDPATGAVVEASPGIVEGLLGFEYQQDCWAARVVLQRFVTAANTTTTALFVQLELTGLGSVGSNPFDILRRNIPGYRLPTMRPQMPSQYFGYE